MQASYLPPPPLSSPAGRFRCGAPGQTKWISSFLTHRGPENASVWIQDCVSATRDRARVTTRRDGLGKQSPDAFQRIKLKNSKCGGKSESLRKSEAGFLVASGSSSCESRVEERHARHNGAVRCEDLEEGVPGRFRAIGKVSRQEPRRHLTLREQSKSSIRVRAANSSVKDSRFGFPLRITFLRAKSRVATGLRHLARQPNQACSARESGKNVFELSSGTGAGDAGRRAPPGRQRASDRQVDAPIKSGLRKAADDRTASTAMWLCRLNSTWTPAR
jgi:hypothetical protein